MLQIRPPMDDDGKKLGELLASLIRIINQKESIPTMDETELRGVAGSIFSAYMEVRGVMPDAL